MSDLDELTEEGFEALAMDVFQYQAAQNPLYARFLSLLGRDPRRIQDIRHIPFLPISLFKTRLVQSGQWTPAAIFSSSATTGQTPSQHLVRDPERYLQNTLRGFRQYYGDPADWIVLALLPAYLERQGSSLVAMADFFIRRSRYPQSGFFLRDTERLCQVLSERPTGVPVLLLGVSFALLDLAEQHPMDLNGVTIMETGGMKGRRSEMTRAELHDTLQKAFGVDRIHSEYGMTELLSQAYGPSPAPPQGDAPSFRFAPAVTMRALSAEINDPFCLAAPGRTGVLHMIDLANIDTCSFIATEDVGKTWPDGTFEALGRLDAAELRGCNLMVE